MAYFPDSDFHCWEEKEIHRKRSYDDDDEWRRVCWFHHYKDSDNDSSDENSDNDGSDEKSDNDHRSDDDSNLKQKFCLFNECLDDKDLNKLKSFISNNSCHDVFRYICQNLLKDPKKLQKILDVIGDDDWMISGLIQSMFENGISYMFESVREHVVKKFGDDKYIKDGCKKYYKTRSFALDTIMATYRPAVGCRVFIA
jgi:hypothetical protein